jgi:hypothetical protein
MLYKCLATSSYVVVFFVQGRQEACFRKCIETDLQSFGIEDGKLKGLIVTANDRVKWKEVLTAGDVFYKTQ